MFSIIESAQTFDVEGHLGEVLPQVVPGRDGVGACVLGGHALDDHGHALVVFVQEAHATAGLDVLAILCPAKEKVGVVA